MRTNSKIFRVISWSRHVIPNAAQLPRVWTQKSHGYTKPGLAQSRSQGVAKPLCLILHFTTVPWLMNDISQKQLTYFLKNDSVTQQILWSLTTTSRIQTVLTLYASIVSHNLRISVWNINSPHISSQMIDFQRELCYI